MLISQNHENLCLRLMRHAGKIIFWLCLRYFGVFQTWSPICSQYAKWLNVTSICTLIGQFGHWLQSIFKMTELYVNVHIVRPIRTLTTVNVRNGWSLRQFAQWPVNSDIDQSLRHFAHWLVNSRIDWFRTLTVTYIFLR